MKQRGVAQLVAQRTHNPQVAGSSPAPAPKNTNIMKYISTILIIALVAIAATAQKPEWARPSEDKYTPNPEKVVSTYSPHDERYAADPQPTTWANGKTTWSWNTTVAGPKGIDLLVGYKIKTGFGARITMGSIVVNTQALNVDAKPDQLLNDLIAALGKAGLLEGVKGLDRPARASISILSWEPIREGFIYSTEQLLTPSTPE